MARVALVTVSDGREAVHRELEGFAGGVEDEIAQALEGKGHEVLRAETPVWSNEIAVREGRRLAAGRPDLTLVNIPIWAFPHFTMLLAEELAGPLVLFSNVDPQYPG